MGQWRYLIWRASSRSALLLKTTDDGIEKMKPLTQRWGFWAAVGGGAAVGVGAGVGTAVALQPEPLPSGDTVVTLP